jgi:hypothetical protein
VVRALELSAMAAERPRKPFTGLKPGSGAKRQAAAPSEVPDDAASGRAQQQQQQEQIADLTDAENRLLEGWSSRICVRQAKLMFVS